MRILITTDTVGGVWTFTRELTAQLLIGGHSVSLVSFGREPSPEQVAWASQTEADYFGAFTYTSSAAPLEWMQDNRRAFNEGAALLQEIAQDFAPDILHSNQFCFGALRLGVPVLVTAHSDVLSWAEACRPHGLEKSAWLAHYNTLVQDGLDAADYVTAPTRWMLAALERNFRVPCAASAIYNGRTIPPPTRTTRRELRSISVGRLWDEAKGLSTLLQLKSPMPIVVAGEEGFETAAAPAPTRLQALGYLPEADLMDAFRASSIYIATSVYEPFGLAPLEAARCGCAVIARDLPSLREIWDDAALYFTDAFTLEHLLSYMAEEPSLLRSWQLAAMDHASHFPAEAMAHKYMLQYQRLLDSAQTPPYSHTEESARHAA